MSEIHVLCVRHEEIQEGSESSEGLSLHVRRRLRLRRFAGMSSCFGLKQVVLGSDAVFQSAGATLVLKNVTSRLQHWRVVQGKRACI